MPRTKPSVSLFTTLLLSVPVLALIGLAVWYHKVKSEEADERIFDLATRHTTPSIGGLPPSTIHFEDVAKTAGLNYQWKYKRPMTIWESTGKGCAFLDYNNDGNLDILLVGPTLALYQGDGKGHFVDVTKQTGLDKFTGRYDGCCVGDYDNDGFPDIYISGFYTGTLLHNEKGVSFTDATKSAGLNPQYWGSSAAFVDLDGDGYLDLVIANYVYFDEKAKPYCEKDGIQMSCGPLDYVGVMATAYHNLKNRTFEDVTWSWRFTTTGAGLGLACADYDNTGRPSLAFANDLRLGDMLHQEPGGVTYRNIGMAVGVGGAPTGGAHAGMGIDWGDYNNDGKLDLFVSTFQHESRSLYENTKEGIFKDVAPSTGITQACLDYLAFGVKFIDVDNDGWLDLLIANGHVQDSIAHFDKKATFLQHVQLLHNDCNTSPHFTDLSTQAGLASIRPIMGRGLAIGDFDNDGRMDALVVDCDGAPLLLHNVSASAGHWLLCKLIGTKSNRDAIGALVTFETKGRKLLRQCSPGGSFLSSSDLRVHVGLGSATQTNIRIKWPSGNVDTYKNVPADQIITLREK